MKSLTQLINEQTHVSADLRDAVRPDTHPDARLAYEQMASETALQSAIRDVGLDMAALPQSVREQIERAMRVLYWSAVSEGLSVRQLIDENQQTAFQTANENAARDLAALNRVAAKHRSKT